MDSTFVTMDSTKTWDTDTLNRSGNRGAIQIDLDDGSRKLTRCALTSQEPGKWLVMETLNVNGTLKGTYSAGHGVPLDKVLSAGEQVSYTVIEVPRPDGSTKQMVVLPHRIYTSDTEPVIPPTEYRTDFAVDENPISEGGAWARNQANAWSNVRIVNGVAHGTQIADTFDDSYAILQGDWGADYELEAVVFRHPSLNVNFSHEVELNVRAADSATESRCYEILFSHSGQIECFRWGGPFDSFTPLAGSVSGFGTINDGDVIRVRIVGELITVWHNDIQRTTFNIASIAGTKFIDGNPEIAMFNRTQQGANPLHYGLKSVVVRKL